MNLWGPFNYYGMNVREANTSDGMVEFDSCWYSTSKFTYQNQVSGGWWPVQVSSTNSQGMWQYDHVGWTEAAVRWYRGRDGGRNRTPCEFRILQVMQIELRSGTWTSYRTNLLKGEIPSLSTVGSSRDGIRTTRTY